MSGIARLGDVYGKGGIVVGNSASSVTVNGRPVALSGANYTPHFNCGPKGPKHCFGDITGSGSGITVEGQIPLTKGSSGTCGESVMTASSDVIIKG
jgi:uncharacterized Zn-binding protein involved in type VI secretion